MEWFKSQGGWRTPLRPSGHNVARTISAQMLRQHAQGLHGTAQDGVLEPKREVDTQFQPYPKKLFLIDSQLEMQN